MKKINFEVGTQISPAKVTIDNVEHNVTPAVYEGKTPLSPFVLNTLQDNIENEFNTIREENSLIVSPTKPTTNEKVWIQKGKNLLNLKNVSAKTQNGLTWSLNIENDTIDVSGTATGYSAISLMSNFVPTNNFIISLNGSLKDTTYVTTQVNVYKDGVSTDLGSKFIIDISEYDFDYFTIGIKRKSNVAINESIKVQVEYGDTVTEYEKYIEPMIYIDNNKFLDVEKIDNQQNYSTQEKKIGTWINGKPLYRKVITNINVSASSKAGTYVYTEIHINNNIEEVIYKNISYKLVSNTKRGYSSPYIFDDGNIVKDSTNNELLTISNNSTNELIATAIIEYTKTTD